MSHYTVQYLDQAYQQQSICEYAEDAFSARNQAVSDVPWLYEHPNRIDCIQVEGSQFCTVL